MALVSSHPVIPQSARPPWPTRPRHCDLWWRYGVWLIWGDRQASEISYMPPLSVSTGCTEIYNEHLATAADCGIFGFCVVDGASWMPGMAVTH